MLITTQLSGFNSSTRACIAHDCGQSHTYMNTCTHTKTATHLQSQDVCIQLGARVLVVGVADVWLRENDCLCELRHLWVCELHDAPSAKGQKERQVTLCSSWLGLVLQLKSAKASSKAQLNTRTQEPNGQTTCALWRPGLVMRCGTDCWP